MLRVSFTYRATRTNYNLYFSSTALKFFEDHSLEVRNTFLKEFSLAFVAAPGYLNFGHLDAGKNSYVEAYIDKIFKKKSPAADETPNRFNFIYTSKTPSYSGYLDLMSTDQSMPDKQSLDTLKLSTVGECSFLYTDKIYKLDELPFEGNNAYVRVKNASINKLFYVDKELKQSYEIPRAQFLRIDEKITGTLTVDQSKLLSIQDLNCISSSIQSSLYENVQYYHLKQEQLPTELLEAMTTERFQNAKKDEASAMPNWPIPQGIMDQTIIRPTLKDLERAYEYKEDNAFQLFEFIPPQELKLEEFKSNIKKYKKDLNETDATLKNLLSSYHQKELQTKTVTDYDYQEFLAYAQPKFDKLKDTLTTDLLEQKKQVGVSSTPESVLLDDRNYDGLAYTNFIDTVKSHYDNYYNQLKPLLLLKRTIAHAIYQAAFNYYFSDKADAATFNSRFKDFNISVINGTNRLSSIDECYQTIDNLSLTELKKITKNLLYYSSTGWVKYVTFGYVNPGGHRCFEKLQQSLEVAKKHLAFNNDLKTNKDDKIFQNSVIYSQEKPAEFSFSEEALALEQRLYDTTENIVTMGEQTLDNCSKCLNNITKLKSKENILNSINHNLNELDKDIQNYKYQLQLKHLQKQIENTYPVCDQQHPFRIHLDTFQENLNLLLDKKNKTTADEPGNLQHHLNDIFKNISKYNHYKKIEKDFLLLESNTSDQHPLHAALTQFKSLLEKVIDPTTRLVLENSNLSQLEEQLANTTRNINNINRFLAIQKEVNEMSIKLNVLVFPNFQKNYESIPDQYKSLVGSDKDYDNIFALVKNIRGISYNLGSDIRKIQEKNFVFKTAKEFPETLKNLAAGLVEVKNFTAEVDQLIKEFRVKAETIHQKIKVTEKIKNRLPAPAPETLPSINPGPLPQTPVVEFSPLPDEKISLCDLIIKILQECDWQCRFGGEKAFNENYGTIKVPKGINALLLANMKNNKAYQLNEESAQKLLNEFEECGKESLDRSAANPKFKYTLFGGVRTSMTNSFYKIISTVSTENPDIAISKLLNLYEKSPKYKKYQPQVMQNKRP